MHALELYNWGTFTKHVWRLPMGGANVLVTGEIGSGKSTFVDALTTLLVPPQRITYNKAAGAERRERTLRGYVLGEYKRSRDEESPGARPIHLRDEEAYSVIIASFEDSRARRSLSLAQLFWLKGGEVQRLFVVSGRTLTVLSDFSPFNGDGTAFKKRLRLLDSTEVFDSFSDYAAAFRSKMGITEKALDLFYQTVSMKTIGDLDDFIRNHMLEPTQARERVASLLANYENLRISHDAVERTRRQRDALLPIAAEGRDLKALESAIEELRGMLDVLPFYFCSLAIPLLEEKKAENEVELERTRDAQRETDERLDAEREHESSIRAAIDQSEVGRRIAEIEQLSRQLGAERDRRRERDAIYRSVVDGLSYTVPADARSFDENLRRSKSDALSLLAERGRLQEERDELRAALTSHSVAAEELGREIASLSTRTSSLPSWSLDLRRSVLDALGATEDDLPFAGELIRVKDSERSWEPAAERILRSFALSLLVSEKYYRQVSRYVRGTNLGNRLVYLRVPDEVSGAPRLHAKSLVRALEVKGDSPFRPWLETELGRRFDLARCDSLDEFYRESEAVMAEGLVKMSRVHHEKDDRPKVADPRYFILGWSNREKIRLLSDDLAAHKDAIEKMGSRLKETEAALALREKRNADLLRLSMVTSFSEIDWQSVAREIEDLRAKRERLEAASDQLMELRHSLEEVRRDVARLGAEHDQLVRRSESLEQEVLRLSGRLASAKTNLSGLDGDTRERFFPLLVGQVGTDRPDYAGLEGGWQEKVRARLETRRESALRKERDVRGSVVRRMQEFRTSFPEASADLSAEAGFLDDFLALLSRLERDDLPAYEQRFRTLLRESTLNDIALFQQQLENDAAEIHRSIEDINRSLRDVEYDPGTYLKLSSDRSEDQDIRDFRADLRRCLENTLMDEELYSEAKFVQVKGLLDRFAGGAPADRSWTDYVTDVRSWFSFTASERYAEDDSEKEFYSSSSGKSGGQKEKLAYTILASALAYKYGMGRRLSGGGFRLVAIDEAFGRGSEESTRYGLELFGKLDLQLLLVTPLQKLSVIEGYVGTVHFVANPEGNCSVVRTLTIEEYRREQQERLARREEAAEAEAVQAASAVELDGQS